MLNKDRHPWLQLFSNVTAPNTSIPKTPIKNHVIEVFVPRAFTQKIRQFERETQAGKPLENKMYKTWFHDEKTRLHTAEVVFLIAKTALCKSSLDKIQSQVSEFVKMLAISFKR